MNTLIKSLLFRYVMIASLGLILSDRVRAQNFATLHNFMGSDGDTPVAGLILSGNTLYGITWNGGSSGAGTVFALNSNGTGFTNLYSFTPTIGPFPYINSDGATPNGLLLSNNTLYGTAKIGGSSGVGTVFKVNTDGTGFTNLHSFTAIPAIPPYTNNDGANPVAGLILSGNTLFGTAAGGGSSDGGTVFAVNIDGTGFTNLYSFTATSILSPYTNNDGATPNGLILSGNTLYGTTQYGGSSGNGTMFTLKTDGTGFTNLYSFTATSGSFPGPYVNSDGANPSAGLILSGHTLFGTAANGGSSGNGTLFAISTDGTGFTNLYSFTVTSASLSGAYTNSDGVNPYGSLILSNNTLYGTAFAGGLSGAGTVFSLNTNGTGFATLYNFTAPTGPFPSTNSDGANPQAGLILSGNTLYGTASDGGSSGEGTVFSLLSASGSGPQLTLVRSGPNVILTWPAAATGFTLQSTTNLITPAVWTNVSPDPVIVNGQNTVTNPVAGTRTFYRLKQ